MWILRGGGGPNELATNWEQYYSNDRGFHISSIARKISTMMILGLLKQFISNNNVSRICEFGGGDSCFYMAFRKVYSKAYYCVLDRSINGVNKFNNKYKLDKPFNQEAQICNLLELDTHTKYHSEFDIVFSAGLIEHFCIVDTKTMIQRHFSFSKSGGIVLITYPTPTLLYRIIRMIAEIIGVWKFYDERALLFDEVHNSAKEYGELLARRLNLAIGLTQEILVYRKF